MVRIEQKSIHGIASRCGKHDGEPGDARPQEASGKQAKKHTEHNIANQVSDAAMKG